MLWVCRETCFWRDTGWKPGDTIEIESKWKWAYSGGLWHKDGVDVVSDTVSDTVHRCFEPTDFSVLANPADVLAARNKIRVPRTFKYKWELPGSEADAAPEDPQPLKPVDLKSDTSPKPFAPSEVRRRGRTAKNPFAANAVTS